MKISVVIPALNAQAALPRTLAALGSARASGVVDDVILVDGGSRDGGVVAAEAAGLRVVRARRGRGRQLVAGARAARRPWLLFLHADTVLEPGWEIAAQAHIARDPNKAAAFHFALDDESRAARRLEWMVALRCAVFRLPYGDQGLLISRALYDRVGGYAPAPLFEDVDLVRRLGRKRLVMAQARAVTSAARFRRDGYGRRSRRNLVLLARYFLGASPERLAAAYD